MSSIVRPIDVSYFVSWDGATVTYYPAANVRTYYPTSSPPAQQTDPAQLGRAEEQAWLSVRELLTRQEKRLLSRYHYLPIKSRVHPGFTYRLSMDSEAPIVYYQGKYVGYLCIDFLDNDMPDADMLLMHKLWIEADEEWYLKEANSWRDGHDTPGACAWLEKEE